jgi:hypothetical protein
MTATAASVIAALHVSQRIKDYGSYAGFACVLGLAVLALLYFAQAREVKRLREWAGRAPERDADLQARVTAQAQQRAAAPPQPAAAAAAPANAAAATAAGAAGAATAAGQAATAKPAQPAAQPAGQQAAQPATPAGQPATPAGQPAPKPGVPAPATAAAAATAAGAASASPASASPQATTPPPSTPKPATPAGANGAVDQPTQITPPPAGGAAPKPAAKPGQPLRPPTPTPSPATAGDHEQSPLRTTLMIVGGVLAVIVVAVVLILTAFSGGSSKNSPNTIGNAPATTPGSSSKSGTNSSGNASAPVSRGDVTVAVLNGTTVAGLAREVGTKLQTAGFKLGTVTNAPDQARSATFVAYQPGHQAEANVVAKLIHVGTDAVKPVDQSTAVVAGQDAFVVVTVGSDQSQ